MSNIEEIIEGKRGEGKVMSAIKAAAKFFGKPCIDKFVDELADTGGTMDRELLLQRLKTLVHGSYDMFNSKTQVYPDQEQVERLKPLLVSFILSDDDELKELAKKLLAGEFRTERVDGVNFYSYKNLEFILSTEMWNDPIDPNYIQIWVSFDPDDFDDDQGDEDYFPYIRGFEGFR